MKTKHQLLTWAFSLALAFLTLSNAAFADAISFRNGNFDAVVKDAKSKKKLICFYAFVPENKAAKTMEKTVFTQKAVAAMFNDKFVNIRLDITKEDEEGDKLFKKLGVQYAPALVFIDPENQTIVHKAFGIFNNEAKLMAAVKYTSDTSMAWAACKRKFLAGERKLDFLKHYLSLLSDCRIGGEGRKPIIEYFNGIKEEQLYEPQHFDMFKKYVFQMQMKPFKYFYANRKAFADKFSYDTVYNKCIQVFINSMLEASYLDPAGTTFNMIKNEVKKSGFEEADKLAILGEVLHFQARGNSFAMFNAGQKFLEKYELDNIKFMDKDDKAFLMNGLAWTAYENYKDDPDILAKSEKWIAKACEYVPNNWALEDTYAAVLYELKKKTEAKKWAEQAIVNAEKDGEDAKETRELLIKIEKLK